VIRRPSTVDALRAILAKDLRVELRTLQSVPAMALFAVTTFVLFRYGLDRKSLSGGLAAGVLLATILFAAILGVNRLFVAERDEGGFDAIRLAPVDGTALLGAKATALVIYLLLLEAIAVPAFALFFLDTWSGIPPLIGVLLLADVGLRLGGRRRLDLRRGLRRGRISMNFTNRPRKGHQKADQKQTRRRNRFHAHLVG